MLYLTFVTIEDKNLYNLLDLCLCGNRASQERLYKEYYSYAMGICLRYSRTSQEAVEILNEGFIKIFSKLDKYSRGLSFKGWLRKIMINTAIDYFRQNEKQYLGLEISHNQLLSSKETVLEKLAADEIIAAVQRLPPSYRLVFNLYAIEGYHHEEIASMLNISVGTSKSNLAAARSKLKLLLDYEQPRTIKQERNG